MNRVTKKLLAGVVVTGACLSMFSGMALAEEEKPTADLTVGAYSQYIWRGFELSKDSIVVQPSMTVGYKGFSANLWGNLDTDPYTADGTDNPNNFNETDLTLSYAWEMGPVAMTAGYIYYALDGVDDTQEFFLSAGLNTVLKPTLTVYRDTDYFPDWYATLAVSHSFPVQGDITLDLAGQVSYLAADEATTYAETDGSKYSNFHDGVVSVGLTVPLNKYFTLLPKLSYTFPLSSEAKDLMRSSSKSGNDDDFIYGGLAVSMSF